MKLATKYRPTKWEDIIEQKSITTILKNQIEFKKLKNSYMLVGGSGCGKTTTGKLIATGLNAELKEVDAASNSGVDNIRDLLEWANKRSIFSEYKVIILDEVHMLSQAAFNALLVTLEEPPQYTIFILCTTDPQKIPMTIQNRCQRYNFTKISYQGIIMQLTKICENEQFIYNLDALDYISKLSNGSMREAITLLDQVDSYSPGNISIENTINALGKYSYDYFFDIANNLLDGNEKGVLKILNDYISDGKDLSLFVEQYLEFCTDIIYYCHFQDCSLTHIPVSYEDRIKNLINFDNPTNYYNYVSSKMLQLKNMIKNDYNIKTTIEVTMLQIARCQ